MDRFYVDSLSKLGCHYGFWKIFTFIIPLKRKRKEWRTKGLQYYIFGNEINLFSELWGFLRSLMSSGWEVMEILELAISDVVKS